MALTPGMLGVISKTIVVVPFMPEDTIEGPAPDELAERADQSPSARYGQPPSSVRPEVFIEGERVVLFPSDTLVGPTLSAPASKPA